MFYIAPDNIAILKTWLESTFKSQNYATIELLCPVVLDKAAATSSSFGSPSHHVFVTLVTDSERMDSVRAYILFGLHDHNMRLFDHTIGKQKDSLLAIEVELLCNFQWIRYICTAEIWLECFNLVDSFFNVVVINFNLSLLPIHLHKLMISSEADDRKLRAQRQTPQEEFHRFNCQHNPVVP